MPYLRAVVLLLLHGRGQGVEVVGQVLRGLGRVLHHGDQVLQTVQLLLRLLQAPVDKKQSSLTSCIRHTRPDSASPQ